MGRRKVIEFAEPVTQSAQPKWVHAMFNNCYEDNARVSARRFSLLLQTSV